MGSDLERSHLLLLSEITEQCFHWKNMEALFVGCSVFGGRCHCQNVGLFVFHFRFIKEVV